jgi:hypothetical protein
MFFDFPDKLVVLFHLVLHFSFLIDKIDDARMLLYFLIFFPNETMREVVFQDLILHDRCLWNH